MHRTQNVGFLIALLLFVGLDLTHGQDLSQLAALASKRSASIEDLAVLMPSLSASVPDTDAYLSRLEASIAAYKPGTPLTKGRASRVACSALELKSSSLYLIFPTERYAFRTLVMEGVFKSASSAGEVMGGMELLDFMNSLASLLERAL